MSINDATPADWDRVRKEHPAIVPYTPEELLELEERKREMSIDYKPYIDMAMQEAHAFNTDPVNNPLHYNSGGIECIEAIKASMSTKAFEGYLKGNCLKYLWRMSYKGKALEDAKKAQWYLQKLIDSVEEIA